MIYKYMSAEIIMATRKDGTALVIEPGQYGWDEAVANAPMYEAPTPPDPIIAERDAMMCSRFQAMVALMDAGLLADVQIAIGGAGPLAQLAWAEATEFHRNSPTIAAIASGLGLTDLQTDDLFRASMAITA